MADIQITTYEIPSFLKVIGTYSNAIARIQNKETRKNRLARAIRVKKGDQIAIKMKQNEVKDKKLKEKNTLKAINNLKKELKLAEKALAIAEKERKRAEKTANNEGKKLHRLSPTQARFANANINMN